MLDKRDLDNFIPIVLCAGFGTRLKPLTNYIPKVVCPILNKPVAFLSIEIFLKAGFKKVHCNTHYLANEVQQEIIEAAKYFGYDSNQIVFWHEEDILETGGGIARIYHEITKNEKNNIGKDAIVVSGDIAADFPLEDMIKKWKAKNSNDWALMCTHNTDCVRKDATWVSHNNNYVLGFGGNFKPNENAIAKVFTTHQIISKDLLNIVEVEKKSSIEIYYKKILLLGKNIINYSYPQESYWFDIGTPKTYLECIEFFEKKFKKELSIEFYNENIINYCFIIPDSLKKYIESNNDDIYLNKINSKKILISFRDKIKNNKISALKEINNDTENFYIIF
ncbi:NDP-sugar synthase [Silvanigrella sp.]|jgi:NDP-sugar pyrophosphorylase family protein|uniref:NDP-sugar synthase n=1 Tax=Silvanigrella sp. TaxID=2024976 RepID=UPI0037C9F944